MYRIIFCKYYFFLIYVDTSRPPREGEKNGQGYYFVDRETMERDQELNKFIEFGEFNGNLYGTKIDTVYEVVKTGKMCVLDVNPTVSLIIWGSGCSLVDSMPAFEAVGRRIDPSQWTQLQFGLFSVPTYWSTTGLSKAVVCTVLSMEKCI